MKMTLLDIVQDILSDMSGDYSNSIGDTEESLQIAQIVKSTYDEMMSRRDWPHLMRVIPLQSYGDNNLPTCLIIPENVRQLSWINYNKQVAIGDTDKYEGVTYLEPRKFLQWCNSRTSGNTFVCILPDGVSLKVATDSPPTYWTSFDDKLVFMDSYVSTLESTLQGRNSQSEVVIYPQWEMTNYFVPNMPAHLFPALLAEAKSTCFLVIKKMANEKAEQQSLRQQRKMSLSSWKAAGGIQRPNYGRKQWIR